MWGLDAIVSGLSAASDYADDAVKFITGGLSSAGSWMQSNPGAATLLGSALIAGGSYQENREAQKNQRNMQQDLWGREDQLRQENGLPANLTPVEFGARIDLDLAVTLLKGRRGDLFIIEKQPLQHYLAIHKLASLNEIGLTYHEHCIGREQPVLLGFARASKYYAERLNPEYERSRPLASGNLPTVIDERSVAGQLRQALKEMEARGEIRRIIAAHTESP